MAEPVVHDYRNIEHRDAVLAFDGTEPALDASGQVITRWDGCTFKKHPATGEDVPDNAAQVAQWRYLNPRPAEWPAADFIVGNPPFIGAGAMRAALGDGYAEALRSTWKDVPESADFVMYWWHRAAVTVRAGAARRFGFITTNSLRQTLNRRVIETHLGAPKQPLTLTFAIPDHPWVDGAGNADVRIAMSVGECPAVQAEPVEALSGRLLTVTDEWPTNSGEVTVALDERHGLLHADMRLGANVAGAKVLRSNFSLTYRGVTLMGSGFWVGPEDPLLLQEPGPLKPLRNGRDIVDRPRGMYAIDFFGLSVEQARERFPAAFQRVLTGVKPERDQSERKSYRDKWWQFAEARPDMRQALAGLSRYFVTSMTAKHRTFVQLSPDVLSDQGLIVFASDDAYLQGVLSSQAHAQWAIVAGGRLGVGNDPRYNNSRCFETFPFPHDDTGLTPALAERIRQLAEQMDAHRKARQAAHEAVTLTGLYNVLDKLRRGEALSAKDKVLHEQGLVSVLQSLHDELDTAVLAAYGWSDLGLVPWADETACAAWTETLLERLVALNSRRAAEEVAGTVRWLRPEFQDPARRATATPRQTGIEGVESKTDAAAKASDQATEDSGTAEAPTAPVTQPWPSALPEQVRAVAQLLAASPAPLALPAIEAAFKGKGPWKKSLPRILETLEVLGRAQSSVDSQGKTWRG